MEMKSRYQSLEFDKIDRLEMIMELCKRRVVKEKRKRRSDGKRSGLSTDSRRDRGQCDLRKRR